MERNCNYIYFIVLYFLSSLGVVFLHYISTIELDSLSITMIPIIEAIINLNIMPKFLLPLVEFLESIHLHMNTPGGTNPPGGSNPSATGAQGAQQGGAQGVQQGGAQGVQQAGAQGVQQAVHIQPGQGFQYDVVHQRYIIQDPLLTATTGFHSPGSKQPYAGNLANALEHY